MQIYQKWDLRRTAYLEFVNGSISPANFDANAASCRYQEEVFKYFTMQVPGNVHGNNVQPKSQGFFCALAVKYGSIVLFVVFTMVEEASRFWGPQRLRQLGGWNRLVWERERSVRGI